VCESPIGLNLQIFSSNQWSSLQHPSPFCYWHSNTSRCSIISCRYSSI